jgi:hypothetical protein
LNPDVEGGNVGLGVASCGGGTANGEVVDLPLDDSSAHHGEGTAHETGKDTLDGREVDAGATESRVDEDVHDGDEDDEREGVEVGENVVGKTVGVHDSCQGGMVRNERKRDKEEEKTNRLGRSNCC